MLVVLLKEVMESSYQLRVIQMVLKHLGRREQDFKEQSWRLRVKKGGFSDLTMALKKNAHL
jgi:hypothetical protein